MPAPVVVPTSALIDSARTEADEALNRADARKERTIGRCVDYITATNAAIRGLQVEFELIIEAFDTAAAIDDASVLSLERRVRRYVGTSLDGFRDQLVASMRGLETCRGALAADFAGGVWRHPSWWLHPRRRRSTRDRALDLLEAYCAQVNVLLSSMGPAWRLQCGIGHEPLGRVLGLLATSRQLRALRHWEETNATKAPNSLYGWLDGVGLRDDYDTVRAALDESRQFPDWAISFGELQEELLQLLR